MTPKPHPQADEAARYVLDQLSPNARHAFELQLTQSAELRTLVQELEEGVEAMARAVPQRPSPPQTWHPIEQAIAREAERKIIRPPFWSAWWRSGWAAAAACLVAFLSYAWWPKAREVQVIKEQPTEIAVVSPPAPPVSHSPAAPRAEIVLPANPGLSAEVKPVVPATNPELASLRWQVTSLRSQLEELSEVVAQQKAILAEPGRFKFFPLTSSVAANGSQTPTPLSPGVQRAIFYAMARDLGWLPGLAQRETPNSIASAGTSAGTFAGVDFVDLTSATEAATGSVETADEVNQTLAATSVASSGTIPGFLARSNLVMAFDKSMIPRGGPVTFWTESVDAPGHQLVGSAVIGDNPTVVTIPTDKVGSGGLTVMMDSVPVSTNMLGHFFILKYFQPAVQPR